MNIADSIAIVAKTFGALPTRDTQPKPYTAARKVSFPAPGLETLYHNGSAEQAALQIYWPTVDYTNITTSARLDLLSALLTGRIRDAVREDLGASYSPGVINIEHPAFPDYGYLGVVLDVKTDDVNELSTVIRNEVFRAITDGFTSDELERARQPLIARSVNVEKTNPYWLNRIAQTQTQPDLLTYQPVILDTYKNTTVDELQALAAEFLLEETAFEIRVLPSSVKVD